MVTPSAYAVDSSVNGTSDDAAVSTETGNVAGNVSGTGSSDGEGGAAPSGEAGGETADSPGADHTDANAGSGESADQSAADGSDTSQGDAAGTDNTSGAQSGADDASGTDESQGSPDSADGSADNAAAANAAVPQTASIACEARPTDTTQLPDGHTVQGLSPSGTTINMFDYWITKPDCRDDNLLSTNPTESDLNLYRTSGINKDHPLHFARYLGNDPQNQDWNKWVGANVKPYQGIVESQLGSDGYPAMNPSKTEFSDSLAYLFSPSVQSDGKASYTNAKGLLQQKDGYYTYDSRKNFAEFNTNSKQFTLYDRWGVSTGGSSPKGQFFPFNTGGQVFEVGDGNLKPKQVKDGNSNRDIESTDAAMNHYFGMTMRTRFIQPTGGYAVQPDEQGQGGRAMTYNFSGDDDVWVFIDGVLVGDLGGVHDRASLQIDFHTGEVVIYLDKTNVGNDGVYDEGTDTLFQKTTLKALFKATQGDAFKESAFDGDTFKGDRSIVHSLDFFYLERGNTDSNMSLKYNLVTAPETAVVKRDQNGEAVRDAHFKLYAAKKNENGKYTYDDATDLLAEGDTDDSGELVLLEKSTRRNLDFDELHRQNKAAATAAGKSYDGRDYYVLKETRVPDGYRIASDEMDLYYQESGVKDNNSGVLLSETDVRAAGSVWNTGSLALGRVTVTAPDTIKPFGGGKLITPPKSGCTGGSCGTIFALVLKRKSNIGKQKPSESDTWAPVTGNQTRGWNVTKDLSGTPAEQLRQVIEAAKTQQKIDPGIVFRVDPTNANQWTATVNDLPGNVTQYYYMLGEDDKAQTRYTVNYYYTTASSLDSATAGNTHRLDVSGSDEHSRFTRRFSASLYISNIKNTLLVQKVDDAGNPINGVTFSLYADKDVTKDNAGNPTGIKNSAKPYDTVTTGDHTGTDGVHETGGMPRLNGAAMFPSTSGKSLNGPSTASSVGGASEYTVTYWLKEETLPDSLKGKYREHEGLVPVYVRQNGVFPSAGGVNDGVKVARGVGYLLKTVSSLGAYPETDNTLTWVKSLPREFTDESALKDNQEASATEHVHAADVVNGRIVEDTSDENLQSAIRFEYDATGSALDYGPRPGNDTDAGEKNLVYMYDTNIPSLATVQDTPRKGVMSEDAWSQSNRAYLTVCPSGTSTECDPNMDADNLDIKPNLVDTDNNGSLDALRLSRLITGTVLVQIANPRIAHAEVRVGKHVQHKSDWYPGSKSGPDFEFMLTRSCDGDDVSSGTITYTGTNSEGKSVDAELTCPATSEDGGIDANPRLRGLPAQPGGGGSSPTTQPDEGGSTALYAQPDKTDASVLKVTTANNSAWKSIEYVSSAWFHVFPELTFTKAGTYVFYLKEVTPTNVPQGWRYDVHDLTQKNKGNGVTVTITVEPSSTPELKTNAYPLEATVSYNPSTAASGTPHENQPGADYPVFVNAYVATSALPFTGGWTPAWFVLGGATLLLLAGAGWLAARRRAM